MNPDQLHEDSINALGDRFQENDNAHLPIFPTTMQTNKGTRNCFGLSKREYFAAMAMQGMLAANEKAFQLDFVASASTMLADKLIEQLNK